MSHRKDFRPSKYHHVLKDDKQKQKRDLQAFAKYQQTLYKADKAL